MTCLNNCKFFRDFINFGIEKFKDVEIFQLLSKISNILIHKSEYTYINIMCLLNKWGNFKNYEKGKNDAFSFLVFLFDEIMKNIEFKTIADNFPFSWKNEKMNVKEYEEDSEVSKNLIQSKIQFYFKVKNQAGTKQNLSSQLERLFLNNTIYDNNKNNAYFFNPMETDVQLKNIPKIIICVLPRIDYKNDIIKRYHFNIPYSKTLKGKKFVMKAASFVYHRSKKNRIYESLLRISDVSYIQKEEMEGTELQHINLYDNLNNNTSAHFCLYELEENTT